MLTLFFLGGQLNADGSGGILAGVGNGLFGWMGMGLGATGGEMGGSAQGGFGAVRTGQGTHFPHNSDWFLIYLIDLSMQLFMHFFILLLNPPSFLPFQPITLTHLFNPPSYPPFQPTLKTFTTHSSQSLSHHHLQEGKWMFPLLENDNGLKKRPCY